MNQEQKIKLGRNLYQLFCAAAIIVVVAGLWVGWGDWWPKGFGLFLIALIAALGLLIVGRLCRHWAGD